MMGDATVDAVESLLATASTLVPPGGPGPSGSRSEQPWCLRLVFFVSAARLGR
jgi:hypothetical protein